MENTTNNILSVYGHRPSELNWKYDEKNEGCRKMKLRLSQTLDSCIKKGYNYFITSMDLGVGQWSVEILLGLKRKYPAIQIEAAVCANQSSRWTKPFLTRYNTLLGMVDKVTTIGDAYTKETIQQRNEYLVNNSKLLLSVWNNTVCDTMNVLNYAASQKKPAMIINPDTLVIEIKKIKA